MAIVTIKASKATPGKALDYITDKRKAAFVSCLHLDPSQDLARQMMATAKLWGKAQNESDRKYYHLKIAFAPEDWVENGGTLTEREALKIGMEIMREFFPGSESVGSVHTDRDHLHVHGLINAVDLQTGRMLDMRNADYRRLKDRVQEICAERGLNAIDWRKVTKDKRAREGQAAEPVTRTFAEIGLQERGKTVWKDELRSIIDQAAASCSSMEEFRAELERQGVTLTRCTEQTISYKMGDHRACRGDTLGGNYTRVAIADAIELNHDQATEQPWLQSMIADAEKKAEAQRREDRVWNRHQEQTVVDRQQQYAFKFYITSDHKPWEMKMYDENGKRLSTAQLLYRLVCVIARKEDPAWFYSNRQYNSPLKMTAEELGLPVLGDTIDEKMQEAVELHVRKCPERLDLQKNRNFEQQRWQR